MILNIICIVLFILVIIVVGVTVYDSNRFVMREYTVSSDKVSKDYDFLFISDLHCKQYGKDNIRLKSAIDGIRADYCFMAGDMINGKLNEDFSSSIEIIDYINKRMPVFYSYGNHEYRLFISKEIYGDMYIDFLRALDDIDVHIYDNEMISIEDFDIYGLSIGEEFYTRFFTAKMDENYVEERLGKPDLGRYNILLAHNPEYFDNYVSFGADLVLSGHVHGGAARIPGFRGVISPKFRLFPKYDGGQFEKGKTNMILSRGLGAHTIPFRIFNPAEIITIHIKKH